MKICAIAFILLSPVAAGAQEHHGSHETQPARLVSGLGNQHHPVSTSNVEAQRFFDQGLAFVYAFNHAEAVRSFQRAAELDPKLAMAHWGVALALGPNINADVDRDAEKAAFEAVQRASSLSSSAPANEQAYITALAKRYSTDSKADLKQLAVDYKNAMGELVNRYPDDLDAATLYAESLMDLHPWHLWSPDGKPNEGTEEIIAVLESVLRRDPAHIGANHYYIHAVEASPNPERGLPSASRLGKLTPAAGHLVHMPAHIYNRTGDYQAAALSNEDAAAADRAYIKAGGSGMYPVMYYSHNLHFLAAAYGMEGRFADALKSAGLLEANVGPHTKEMQTLDSFMATSTLVLIRFRRWNDILKSKEPDRKMPITAGMWHFARGLAFAAAGNTGSAETERAALQGIAKAMPPFASMGLNSAHSVFRIAGHVLSGRIAMAKQDPKASIEELRAAVEAEDKLTYDEPPAWFLPARETLGGLSLLNKDYAEAEKVFRDDLTKNPRSGRSLFGLVESLKAQGKTSGVPFVQAEFEAAWKNADTRLRIEDL